MSKKTKILAAVFLAITFIAVFFIFLVLTDEITTALLGTLAVACGLLFIGALVSGGQNLLLRESNKQQNKIIQDLSKVLYRTEDSRAVAGSVGRLRQNAEELLKIAKVNDEALEIRAVKIDRQFSELVSVIKEHIPETQLRSKPVNKRNVRELNVAIISDEFTFNSFAPEFNLLSLTPGNWHQIFENNHIDFFFCESAWSGVDTAKRPWLDKIFKGKGEKENRTELLEILEFCKKNSIPTVFWNKEDPIHYSDERYNFADTASRFDHIFTTDENTVERYVRDYGHESVHTLGFGVQPRLYNPLGAGKSDRITDEILFAGAWYKNHKERSRCMQLIFDEILRRNIGLKILDRSSSLQVPNRIYPEKYQHLLHPAISHTALATEFKKYKYGLNFNTVTESSTMFARRVFELSASNVAVISNWSKGVEEIFGDKVLFADRRPELLDLLGTEELDRRAHAALITSLKHHTYQHRAMEIVEVLGLDVVLPRNEIYLLQIARSEADLPQFKQQREKLGESITGATVVLDFAGSSAFTWNTLDDGTNLISAQVLENDLVDIRAFLPTDFALVAEASTPLDAQAVSEATAHTQYAEHPISVAESTHKFEYGYADSPFGLVLPVEDVKELLANSSSQVVSYFI